MNPRLLEYYNTELRYMREMGGEFAREYPKIAGRLALDEFECTDPYVERLLEGFAFMAARVQFRLDAEFPEFTQHLLEMVYPHYLAPTPSMAVVQLQPDLSEGSLAEGFKVPRDSVLRSLLGKDERTPCEFRTAHDITLWPLEITEAEYVTNTSALPDLTLLHAPRAKAGIRLRLRTTAGLTFDKLALDRLTVYLRGSDEIAMRLYEQLLGNATGMVVEQPGLRSNKWQESIDKSCIRPVGFEKSEAMLPYGPRSFGGYRLLHEYLAFPDRYTFVELAGLGPAVRKDNGSELEITILLNRSDVSLEHKLDPALFALYCAPAINLFPKHADRIHLNTRDHEYHVIPDRTRPMDFEVYQVTGVAGFGTSAEPEQEFQPFYSSTALSQRLPQQAYYHIRREQRLLSSQQQLRGTRTRYIGSEVFVSLSDADAAPYSSTLRQFAVSVLCTNRDLPLLMQVGGGKTDFTLETAAPVNAVRCVAGPCKPRPSYAHGEKAWRLVSHLALNYLSLVDSDNGQGVTALRELLTLYGDVSDASIQKQIDGIKSVAAKPAIRRMPAAGPIAFGRGLEVTVTMDEGDFEGSGCFLMGAVLQQFFAKYVSINSFTETVIRTTDRGEIMRWPVKTGRRRVL